MSLALRMALFRRQGPLRCCTRCGKRYPESMAKCPYCSELSGVELERFRRRVEAQHAEHSELGRVLLWLALLLVIGMVILLPLF